MYAHAAQSPKLLLSAITSLSHRWVLSPATRSSADSRHSWRLMLILGCREHSTSERGHRVRVCAYRGRYEEIEAFIAQSAFMSPAYSRATDTPMLSLVGGVITTITTKAFANTQLHIGN
ncbi:hypothetical protein LIA77_04949 [Sarocladium implicatum]|nr:hypothetical protein LIA77_04949 [Sarocladium implicatum]